MQSNLIFLSEMKGTKKCYLYAVSNIANSSNTRLTSYPTTDGTSISDNAYREPYRISMNVSISELNTSKNSLVETDDDTTENRNTPTMEDLKKLFFSWKENFTRLVLQTRHTQYTNMIITSISWNDNNNTYGTFNPSITFSECRVASIETISVGPCEDASTSASYSQESFRGIHNGSAIGSIASGAVAGTAIGIGGAVLLGASLGGKAGTLGGPLGIAIGAGVGLVAGTIYGIGNYLDWW